MFCKSCGKKTKKDAKYCGHCGKKIKPSKIESLPKHIKLIAISLICLIILLILFLSLFSNKYKVSNIAKDYFLATMDTNPDALYEYLGADNKGLTSKKIYHEVTEQKKSKLINYNVVSETKSKDNLSAKVDIRYTEEGSAAPKNMIVNLIKEKGKKLLFFDNWKVSNQNSALVENYKLKTIKNASVKLEGVKLDKKYLDKSNDSYDIYTIPKLFKGKYDVLVTLNNGLEFESEINVNNYDSTFINNLELSDKSEKKLEEKISSIIQSMYTNAIENKEFKDVKNIFEKEKVDLAKMENMYESFKSTIVSSGLKSFKLKDIDIQRYEILDDSINITVKTKYDYKAARVMLDKEYTKENSGSDINNLSFVYEDNDFKLTSMSSMQAYFSVY